MPKENNKQAVGNMILRYVIHAEIEAYENKGWEIISHLKWPHSQHAVVMKKVIDVEQS